MEHFGGSFWLILVKIFSDFCGLERMVFLMQKFNSEKMSFWFGAHSGHHWQQITIILAIAITRTTITADIVVSKYQ